MGDIETYSTWSTLREINERVATNARLLRTLVQNTHNNVSTHMVLLLPVSKKNGFKKYDPRNLLCDQAKLVFHCGYTMELVHCGPKKNGYSVKDLKTWVKKKLFQYGCCCYRLG